MKYLQAVIPGRADSPDLDECPHCGRTVSRLVELTDSATQAVIDRGCEPCIRRRNVW